MDKSMKWIIAIVIILLGTLLTINLVRKSNYKKYIYNNTNKIEYVNYEIKQDSLRNDTTYHYELVDTINNYKFYKLKYIKEKCYITYHMKHNTFNFILDTDLKYTFKVKNRNENDSLFFNQLDIKKDINYLSKKQ